MLSNTCLKSDSVVCFTSTMFPQGLNEEEVHTDIEIAFQEHEERPPLGWYYRSGDVPTYENKELYCLENVQLDHMTY